MSDDYLRIGNISDLKNKKDRLIYRFFEILPGLISWLTLFFLFLLSWLEPIFTAFFIISFDLYWLLKTIYFAFHLRFAYQKMKKYEKIDWLKKVQEFPGWEKIYHLVLLPTYQEPLEIIRETLRAILRSDYPKEKIIVVLSFEERAGQEAKEKAKVIKEEFEKKFFHFLITFHPANLPNEIPGHGSNDAWAAKKAKELIIDQLKIPYENIIVSSFDIDTSVFPKYFSCLTFHYLSSPNPSQNSFQPIPLYLNNIWRAHFFSRVFSFSTSFWHSLNQERPEKLVTFSSHAMSFKALFDVGFKLTNVVSDDSRIFWQCFLKYNGNYQVLPIYYSVSMDANFSESFFKTLINIYKQQRRWAYGVAEIPYLFFGFLKNRKIKILKKIQRGLELFESHWSWATNSFIIFLFGWLPLILGREEFNQTLLSYNLPTITSWLLTLAMIGILGSIYISLLLLPPKPPEYGRLKYLAFIVEWFFLPLMMIFFTSLPSLESQTRLMLGKYLNFWPTEKIRKK